MVRTESMSVCLDVLYISKIKRIKSSKLGRLGHENNLQPICLRPRLGHDRPNSALAGLFKARVSLETFESGFLFYIACLSLKNHKLHRT